MNLVMLFLFEWYWVILGLGLLTTSIMLSKEDSGSAFVVILVLSLLGYLKFDFTIATITDNLWFIAVGMMVYISIGVGVSIVKWWQHVSKRVLKYLKLRRTFLKSEDDSVEIPQKDLKKWFDLCYEKLDISVRGAVDNPLSAVPNVSKMSGTIVMWIMYWPFFLISLVANDFMYDLIEKLVDYLRGIYQMMANRIAAKILNDTTRFSTSEKEKTDTKDKVITHLLIEGTSGAGR